MPRRREPLRASTMRKVLLSFAALLLLGGLLWSAFRARTASPPLAVVLVKVQNDPLSHWHQPGTVLHGGRGLCAIFAVTNTSPRDRLWFNTWALEEKIGPQWRRTILATYASRNRAGHPAFLIDSEDVNDLYPPGRAWYYVVPWPSGIPTNATWRLLVRYGKAPSPLTIKLADTFDFTKSFGFTLFNKRRPEGTLVTAEVRP